MDLSISCMLHVFFLGCLLSLSNSTCTDLKDCFSKVRPGKLDGYVIKSFSNKGYCFRHPTICRSFNYDKFTGLCELNSRTPESTTLNEVTKFVNSLVPSVQPNDLCSPTPCSPTQMCAALSSGATTCVKDLPLAETAMMVNDTEQYFKAGEIFVFNCTSGYTKLNSRICRANGTWKQSLPLCAIKCNFDEPCHSLQLDSSTVPLSYRRGPTPASSTGCDFDHTSGYVVVFADNQDQANGCFVCRHNHVLIM